MWNNHVSFVIKMCGDMLISFNETDTKHRLTEAWYCLKSTKTRLLVRSTAFCKLVKTGPLWGRDPLTEGMWWQLSMKWRHDQCKDVMSQTPDIFSLADTAWKRPEYPCFCILPLEFGVNIDIHKHENSEVLCSNRNKSLIKEMSGNSRLQIRGTHVNRFHLTNCTG